MVEILDVVNEDDEVIDTLPRDEIYAKGLQYVRVVEAFIRKANGDFWVPIRTLDKKIAPGGFDIGAAGHVEHGETYDEALRKEVREEIGWNTDTLTIKPLGKFGPKDGLATVSMVYEIMSEDTPILNPDDFISAKWMSLDELVAALQAGHPAKSNIAVHLRNIYGVQV